MVSLEHQTPRKLIATRTKAGIASAALYYLGKENVTNRTIQHIKKQLGKNEFNNLFQLIHHMPIWMSKVFFSNSK